MKFKYIVVYQIRGLIHNANEEDKEIYAKESNNALVRAILSVRPDLHCYDIDRATAISYLMIKGMVGREERDDLQAAIKIEIERMQEQRKKELAGSEALIFVAEGEAPVDLSGPIIETDDYVLGFDIIDKDALASVYRDQINIALSALCLATERVSIQVKKLRGNVYLINDVGKPVYSISASVSGEGYTSMQTTAEIVEDAKGQIKIHSKLKLSKVYILLAQAISRDNDELRRFMFGWAALETLINKVFSEYEKLFVQSLRGSEPANKAHQYFARMREVMKGKYNIAIKFEVVAGCIGDAAVEADIQEFIKIMKVRNALFHDRKAPDNALPTTATVELLKKYLRLHIKNKGRLIG